MHAADVPALVTLHLWRVPGRGVPGAVARMAAHRPHLRRTPGLSFARLLGTGHGRTFSARVVRATARRVDCSGACLRRW